MLNKPLPSNDDAERCVLGGILIDNEFIKTAAETLTPEDFYSPFHRVVFKAMLELHSQQKTIDPIVIGEALKRDGMMEVNTPTVTNLSFGLPYFTGIDEYVEIIEAKSRTRELIRTCNKITSDALAEDVETSELMTAAQNLINDLCLRTQTGTTQRFENLETIVTRDVAKTLDNLRHGISNKIKTGFPAIDSAIGGGISPSDVMLVVADTGAGKSALALQMAYQIACQNIPVAFLAGEMTNGENVNRLLSQVSGITNLNWLTHITDNEYDSLHAWAEHIKNVPLLFDHRTTDLQTLGSHLRSIVRRQGVKVLVIDYIQLLKVDKLERRKRTERISEVSQEIKRLAQDLGIAIIEVAQFNREGAKSGKPSLHDLEGSGQIEKDASLICILEQGEDDVRDSQGRKYRRSTLRVVKGRNSGLAEIDGKFYGASLRFEFE